jgi:hypothetical protein
LRHLWSFSGAHDVKDAANDFARSRTRDTRRRYARANLDAFAAPRASVEHVLNPVAQRRLERDLAHRLKVSTL